ncbi:hypothetical protein D3C72_501200 [compost metagenome]
MQAQDAIQPDVVTLRLGEGLYRQVRRDNHFAKRQGHGAPLAILVRCALQGIAVIGLGLRLGVGCIQGVHRHAAQHLHGRGRRHARDQRPRLQRTGRAADPRADHDDGHRQQDLPDILATAAATQRLDHDVHDFAPLQNVIQRHVARQAQAIDIDFGPVQRSNRQPRLDGFDQHSTHGQALDHGQVKGASAEGFGGHDDGQRTVSHGRLLRTGTGRGGARRAPTGCQA